MVSKHDGGSNSMAVLEGSIAERSDLPSDVAIYQAMADAIFEQRLPPGTKLAEDTLGRIFDVSRTVVRKALYRLASEKVVEIRPNRGAMVASPSVEEAHDVFAARRVVEAAIVRKAVTVIEPRHLRRLQTLVDKDHKANDAGNRRAAIRYSGAFHLELAEIAGNQVLKSFLKELIARTSLIIVVYESPRHAACTHDEHAQLMESIAAGGEAAVAAMISHLEGCERRLGLNDDVHVTALEDVFASDS